MPRTEGLSGLAPAKVNLTLRVGHRRPDGFHEIDTVLQTLSLADEVFLKLHGTRGLTVDGPFADGTPADDSNLALRAAAQLARLAHQSLDRVSIHLEKRIPPAAGLGGGASDAVTTLRLLQRAWANVREEMLIEVANRIGSDEAFFLIGGTVRARGRGERVSRLPDLNRHDVVLFVPEGTIADKTARMFAAFDAMTELAELAGEDAGDASALHLDAITPGAVVNSFTEVAFSVFPGLGALRDAIQERIGESVCLAGAGPTLFWIGRDGRGASIAAKAKGVPCLVIQTATAASQWQG